MNYLATRGPDLEPFVIGSLIQLFCRVIKFGWLDDDSFREVVKESMNFLNQVMTSACLATSRFHCIHLIFPLSCMLLLS